MTMTGAVETRRTRLEAISNDGTTIAYTRQGWGPVVVLVARCPPNEVGPFDGRPGTVAGALLDGCQL